MNRRPLDPKDLYKIQTVGRAEVSPDGEHIVSSFNASMRTKTRPSPICIWRMSSRAGSAA